MSPTLQSRCWNHEAREAVCRCPQCGRSFCRECVTEHESRLLCATCLNSLARVPERRRTANLRRLLPAALAVAGVLLAWTIYFGAAEGLIAFTARLEQSSWPNR